MQKVLTAEEMREVDRLTTEKYGIPSILLMENAAHAAADVIKEKLGGSVAGKSFLILCGKGNNGGDGAALGRILWQKGADVVLALIGKIDETRGDAKKNFRIAKKIAGAEIVKSLQPEIIFHQIKNLKQWNEFKDKHYYCFDPEIIIDALFGTGLTRPISGLFEEVAGYIRGFNIAGVPDETLVISVDLPSGFVADLNERIGMTPNANFTITFTAPKLANVLPPASNFNGELFIVNIGSPQELIDASPSKTFLYEKEDAKKWLEKTKFTSDSYKNKRGHALLIAGSNNYAGAAVLSGNSAIVSGVGLVTIATPESSQTAIASRVVPEVMTRGVAETKGGAVSEDAFEEISEFIEKSIDAVAIGSGLSSSEESTKKLVRKIVEERKTPVVIDADGLNSLAPFDLQGNEKFPLILTPHEGEFLKLLGTKNKDILKDRIKVARNFAEKHKVILVLKGERVLTVAPDGRVVINPTGNSGLGKAGNGDTLTGIITGFIAQAVQMKVDIFETICAAVYISSLAGDIAAEKFGKRVMLASDVRDCLGEAFEAKKN